MKTRQLGNTDLNLTAVGLGTWAIGGPWQFGWGPQDDGQAIAAIIKAFELEINWIDTAPIYGLGHSEQLIGKALKESGYKPLIATKCGLRWNEKREKVDCLEKQSIRKECDESLKRLGIDVIDLWQVHWPQPDDQLDAAWEQMAKMVDQGKIRYLGICNATVDQIQRVSRIHPCVSLQPPYHMLRRDVEKELLPFCQQNNLGVVAYSPMARGLLTGKFSKEYLDKLPADDHRKTSADFTEPAFSATVELVEQLKKIADRLGITCAQLAIAWVLRKTEVTSAIAGARSPGQIEETAPAAEIELSDADIETIEKLLAERDKKIQTQTIV